MKKKIFGLALAMLLVLSQIITVVAAPSPGKDVNVSDDSYDDGYRVEIQDDMDFDDILDKFPPEKQEELKDKTPISPVIKFDTEGTPEKVPSMKVPDKLVHRVEIYVPNLSEDMTDIWGELWDAYYQEFETMEPVYIDYENKIVVFEFDELPEFMILFSNLLNVTPEGTSPETGVVSTWMIWVVLAAVLLGVSFYVSRRLAN